MLRRLSSAMHGARSCSGLLWMALNKRASLSCNSRWGSRSSAAGAAPGAAEVLVCCCNVCGNNGLPKPTRKQGDTEPTRRLVDIKY
eukprot:845882-Rhodomonas_salina.2